MKTRPHLELAHRLWSELLQPADTAIDATCGNGKDTLRLAQLLPQGRILALDIQERAILHSKEVLTGYPQVEFYLQSHVDFPAAEGVKLIVYNLGYLPGANNKALTTLTETTLQSVEKACHLVQKGGAISIMCYPGHPEGAREEEALIRVMKSAQHYRWNASSPSLIWFTKT